MARKKNKSPAKSCADCIHENACQAWNVGTIHNTDATNCVNHETVKDSNAYFIGFLEGKKQSGENTTLEKIKECLEELCRMIPNEQNITEVEIKRAGNHILTVHIHPISDPDIRAARKKATRYMPNPNGKKLPPVEQYFDNARFGSWVIYLATTEEDQKKIWGDPAIMESFDLLHPSQSIDVILTLGEKCKLMEVIYKISKRPNIHESRS